MTTIDLLPIIRIIRRTISEARDADVDYLGQTQRAALAVVRAMPDIPAHEALSLVERVRYGI